MTHSETRDGLSEATEGGDLPLVAPDGFEEQHPEAIDNAVPSRDFHVLPVVGLGGSAGSIPALKEFFESLPADTGFAYVVVLHLAPDHHSLLPELLQRHCSMPVRTAENADKLEANNVYVIPPGKHLTSADGHLRLTDLNSERGRRVSVDIFFRSLADTHGPRATAVVLSGADGDGAVGLKRIKERGGLTIAQDPEEAEHASMPQSAIATGMVDWVLRVAEMPARMVAYRAREANLKLPAEEGPQPAEAGSPPPDRREALLREILAFLRARTGRDFSYYKRSTIVRRIARRMQVSDVEDLGAYLSVLRTQPGEGGVLLAELLISVTNFFRDRECFQILEGYIPELFREKGPEHAVRIWVAACASGEEAYSMAMLLLEHARKLDSPPALQVFACDLDEDAIAVARAGLYPETIVADVSEERLRRFFVKEPGGYRIRREVREMVLFATHDLLKDAPFSRIDLLSCRNLLIYLNRDAQARCIEIFNFSLNPGGLLFLGSSESVDEGSPLFSQIDKKHRIFRQRPVHRIGLPLATGLGESAIHRVLQHQERLKHTAAALPSRSFLAGGAPQLPRAGTPPEGAPAPNELHFRLVGRWGPASAVINADHEVVHLSENANRFLQLPEGHPTSNLLRLVHPMLRADLRSALLRAEESGEAAEVHGHPVQLAGGPKVVDIRVAPAGELAPGHFLVMFDAREPGDTEDVAAAVTASAVETEPLIQQLERELARASTKLHTTIEQYEASSEELKASNEELQSMNEELRSAGEELESGREELQSVNEELTTLNAEFKARVEELGRVNSDLHNLMSATQIATVFLDRDLQIMRYTPSAVPLFNLILSDVGRPITDLKQRLDYPELSADAHQVLRTLVPVEREMREDGHWFLARVLPYRTVEDHIAGLVLTFIDISDRKAAEGALRASEQRLRTLADAVPQIIWANDGEGRAIYFNRRWHEYSGRSFEESVGPGWQAIVHPDDMPAAVEQWQRVLAAGQVFDCEYRLRGADGAYRWFIGRNVPTLDSEGHVDGWFGTATDIEDLKKAEASLRASEEQFRRAIEDAPIPVIMHAEDGQVLQISKTWTELTGFGAEEIPTFEAWFNHAYGPGAGKVRDHMHELFRGEVSALNAELEVPTRDGGSRYWILSASAPGRLQDGRRFVIGMVLDITDRRRAEEQLRESQERLRLIVENARDYAIFAMDLQRRITSWNAGAQAILGYAQEEVVGVSGDLIYIPEDRAQGVPEGEAEKALAEGRATNERWHVRKDGSRFWGAGVMMPMHDGQGAAVGYVKIFRDHTAELHAREALEGSRQQLQSALQETESARDDAQAAGRAKDHFLAVLSHELRTPLTPILLAAHALSRSKSLPDGVLNTLAIIERNARLQAQLIDDLLDVTRIAHGKMELSRQNMDLHGAVTRAVEVASADMEAKSQHLSVDLAASEHTVWGDAKRLQQVFWNLLKNASKFTPQHGEVFLRSRNDVAGHVVVEVSDLGVGFEPASAERIFAAFEQGNTNVTREYGGLGLGLAIAEASVKAHGGRIHAASPGAGMGATFTVELPLAGREPAEAPAA